MKHKLLGKTEIEISAIGMGTAHYPYNNPWVKMQQGLNIEFASALGMTFIDTAESYGGGLSEEAIGGVSPEVRKKLLIGTKVSARCLYPDDLKLAVEGSLFRLKADHIDLYYIHWPNPKIPMEQTMQVMSRLVEEGKIRYIGLSNFSFKDLKEAIAVSPKDISALQVEYNLLDRGVEKDLLPFCQDQGITLVASSPLNQGDLKGKVEGGDVLERLAGKYQKTAAQIVLNWLVLEPAVVAIPKTMNPVHMVENATATDFILEDDDIELISSTFPTKILEVPVEQIRVVPWGLGDTKVYQTLEEAKQNTLGLVPSPEELAQDMRESGMLKPVRVVPNTDVGSKYKYDLVEGRLRYWAWTIAFDGERPISVLVR